MNAICTDYAGITEGDLMAYVDGTADEATARHIRHCPACARQVEALAAYQAILTAKLYRFSCLTPEQLIGYQRGELRGNDELVAAQHLRQCPHCARELATLTRNERASLGERVRAVIKVLDAVLVTPQTLPQTFSQAVPAAGVRSAPGLTRSTPQVYRAGEIEVIVSQRPSRTHPSRWDVSGLVHTGGRVPEAIGEARVELYRGEGLIAIAEVGPRGQFVFTAMELAAYDISLVWQDQEMRMRGVQVT